MNREVTASQACSAVVAARWASAVSTVALGPSDDRRLDSIDSNCLCLARATLAAFKCAVVDDSVELTSPVLLCGAGAGTLGVDGGQVCGQPGPILVTVAELKHVLLVLASLLLVGLPCNVFV